MAGRILEVPTRTLDSFGLSDVGFLKIDVEGHELALLAGARRTIESSRPVVFVESESRHAVGAPANVIDLMMRGHGYRRAAFLCDGKILDIASFDVGRDQLQWLPDVANSAYVSNFVFWP